MCTNIHRLSAGTSARGAYRCIRGHVVVDLLSAHAIEYPRVGLKYAASQGVVVAEGLLVPRLLLLYAQALQTDGLSVDQKGLSFQRNIVMEEEGKPALQF